MEKFCFVHLLLCLSSVYSFILVQKSHYNFKLRNVESSDTQNLGNAFVNLVINFPPVVNIARQTMIKSATSVGVDWEKFYETLKSAQNWEENIESVINEDKSLNIPDYFKRKFHGYKDGNLCIEAALEQELAGKAVGARNFPDDGILGEEVFRSSYETQMKFLGGYTIYRNATIVDMGCGTGTSTRRLAREFPQAKQIIGIDLSPHMIAVGRYLLSEGHNIDWVTEIEKDDRISLRYGDIENTKLEDNSVDMVSISLVLHELPEEATINILKEAYRILKPNGVLAIMEMDPETPGYTKLRSNIWLYPILRSTEPYLDEYFRLAPNISNVINEIGFPIVRKSAPTGRHFAIVAFKGGVVDLRPSNEEYKDTHVQTRVKDIPNRK
jgi:ubiquinone/menaquinone biosynthesis C-methylase UbiE